MRRVIHFDLAVLTKPQKGRRGLRNETILKRLRWRCRRGTRELDALLGGWLDVQGQSANEATLAAFDALLDQSDPEIWDWLMGHAQPSREEWKQIVAQIRSHEMKT